LFLIFVLGVAITSSSSDASLPLERTLSACCVRWWLLVGVLGLEGVIPSSE
jgi:hypothetical protein